MTPTTFIDNAKLMSKGQVTIPKDVRDVLERAGGLVGGFDAIKFTGGRIDAELTGDEDESVRLHGLAVGAERRRSLRRRDRLEIFVHDASFHRCISWKCAISPPVAAYGPLPA